MRGSDPAGAQPGAAEIRQLGIGIGIVVVASLISLPYWLGWLDPPRLSAVMRAELVVYCVILLISFGQLRDLAFAIPEVPAAMIGFVDLTLALSRPLWRSPRCPARR